MSTRDERRERAEARAERAQAKAEAAGTAFDTDPAHHIPLGQPILVGHHSQRRHERDLERMHRKLGQAVAAQTQAEAAADRAQNAGGSIHVGDTDAVEALRARVEKLAAEHESALAHNRSGGNCITECWVCERDYQGQRVPSFTLANSRNRVKHAREQLRKAEAQAEAATLGEQVLAEGAGWELVRDPVAARVRFVFDGKPDEPTRDLLKSRGFRWAPSVGAWQRQDTANGLADAKRLARMLNENQQRKETT